MFVCLFVVSIYCIANYRSKCLGPDAFSASPRYEGHLSLKNTLFSQLGSPSLALLPNRKRIVRTSGASQGQLLCVVCRVQAAWANRSFISRSLVGGPCLNCNFFKIQFSTFLHHRNCLTKIVYEGFFLIPPRTTLKTQKTRKNGLSFCILIFYTDSI